MNCHIFIQANKDTQFLRANAFAAAIKYEEETMPNNQPGKANFQLIEVMQISGLEYAFKAWHQVSGRDNYKITVFITIQKMPVVNEEG